MATETLRQVEKQLPSLIPGLKVSRVRKPPESTPPDIRPDLLVSGLLKGRPITFAVEVKSVGEPRYIRQAAAQLRAFVQKNRDVCPLLVMAYISPNAQQVARAEGVSYVDLAGNVWLDLKDVYVERVAGRPERKSTKPIGRPFSPVSSRVVRVLLELPTRSWTLSGLADESRVSLALASRVVRKLAANQWVTFKRVGKKLEITTVAPGELLDAWSTQYSFLTANSISRLYSFDSNPEHLMRRIAVLGKENSKKYAFTLTAGAVLVAPGARVTDAAFYVEGDPGEWISWLDLRQTETGANVLIAKPFDAGVFYRLQNPGNGLTVVGNVQLYLDLSSWKGRGMEQAVVLRRQKLGF